MGFKKLGNIPPFCTQLYYRIGDQITHITSILQKLNNPMRIFISNYFDRRKEGRRFFI